MRRSTRLERLVPACDPEFEGGITLPRPAISEPLRIVSIGGGTGLAAVLRGLRRYGKQNPQALEITAIVTVTDDGGSSGRLRREFDVLPPGDIRNCMVALSEDEALLSRLFQYRFSNGRGLKGHSFGNLFLTAMTHVTGDFAQAVKISHEVLASAGRIFPSTAANVTLEAILEDGRRIAGETKISRAKSRIDTVALRPRRSQPLPEALEAIANADLITFGPGSLYTSVIPNLLVEGIPGAIAASPALKAYFMNLMWQPGETTDFRASDHLKAVFKHSRQDLIDVCVVNARPVKGDLLKRYEAQKAHPVEIDRANIVRMGVALMEVDLLRMSDKIRHDPSVTGAVAIELAQRGRRRKRKTA
jgi:uncharacterized cofD-like protein